jgi:hypothetical protein
VPNPVKVFLWRVCKNLLPTKENLLKKERYCVAGLQWKSPPQGVYKVDWDATIEHTNKCLGIDVIVQDHLYHMIVARSQTTCIVSEPVIVEAIVTLNVAEFSSDFGLQSIILKGDSLQVVNALKTNGQNWSQYGQIVEDAKSILTGLRSWQIHIKREANFAAHELTKAATKQVMDSVWMEEISLCVCDIVTLEQHALLS